MFQLRNNMKMKFLFVRKADHWLTERLSYPGIDSKQLVQRKIYWSASLAVTLMIGVLTLTYHLIFPDLRILIYYGSFLVLTFSQGVFVPLLFRKITVGIWYTFVNQTLVAIATLVAVLKMGGIPHSGGLILVGLAMVFFSLNYKKKIATILIFCIHIVTVVLMGVLHPFVTVPAEMTPTVNISLFVINILWISGFAFVFVMNFISQQVGMEKRETERLKELNDAKSRFYTNITHEFRTPLTVIMGMTDLIRDDPGRWLAPGAEKIQKNASVLLNHINQLLDLAKLESGMMPVKMICADIISYIRYIIGLYETNAQNKAIELEYRPGIEDTMMDFDPDKLTMIVSNLLLNAIKFTPEGGKVLVTTRIQGNNKFTILVRDTGPGIPKEKINRIFDRFYRVEEGPNSYHPGTGLGLSLVKELVKLLGGEIDVESDKGKGSAFNITLPITRQQPHTSLKEYDLCQEPVSHDYLIQQAAFLPGSEQIDDSKPLLLVVEDNMDVNQYLHSLLERDYHILFATDGTEGLEKALQHIPDIILSDIMMKGMDGISMLDRLKNDLRTSHIPIIMLTAKADIRSRIEGLERGADAYITKPFRQDELRTQMVSLLESRKALKERYSHMHDLDLFNDEKFIHEDGFMDKIRQITLNHLQDESFGIKTLCEEIAMSRTQLYRKFKSLSENTVSDYLRTIRLNQAKEMLLQTDHSVSEVAYLTGFKNISHFSRVFKMEFDINPSKYVRK